MIPTHIPLMHRLRTRTDLFRKTKNFKVNPQNSLNGSSNKKAREALRFSALTSQTTKVILSRFSKISNDQRRRRLYAKNELRRQLTSGALEIANARRSTPLSFVYSADFDLSKATPKRLGYLSFTPLLACYRKKVGSFTRIRNRCVLTSHPSSIGKLGLSRICFRAYAGAGKLPGLFKL